MDILEFLEAKSWEEGKLNHFNLSVLVDDAFMKAKDNDETITLRYPCMTETGEIIDNPNEWKMTKEIKAREIWDTIMKKAYETGEYGVLFYDNLNKDNNINYMETIVTTNPCGEYLAGTLYENGKPLENHLGACNLGSLFLHNFIENPFTKNACIDYVSLKYAINTAVRMLDNVIDINSYPLKAYENYQKNIRTIGLGTTGLADMLCMLNLKYDSEEAVCFMDILMDDISYMTYQASIELAKEKGCFPYLRDEDREKFANSNYLMKHYERSPRWKTVMEDIKKYGIRNARLQATAPTGTLSLTYGNNCSSGLEPIFSLEYERKIKVGGQNDENIQIYPMRDYAYEQWLKVKDDIDCVVKKDVFQTAMDLSVDAHVNMLGVIAFHTDMSCSKTINIPTDYPFEKTKEVYDRCHKLGIKGCTIFRPNPLRSGILVTEKQDDGVNELKELKRGEWKSLAEDTYYVKRKLTIGCGTLKLFIGYSPNEQAIQDLYIVKSGNGGCEKNLQAIAISMSALLRVGGSIEQLEKAFSGIAPCPSFVSSRAKGLSLSKGNYCGMAIINEVKSFLEEVSDSQLRVQNKKNEEKKNIFTEEEEKFLKENGESVFAFRFNKCPQCGEKLERADGCITCIKGCGWTKC